MTYLMIIKTHPLRRENDEMTQYMDFFVATVPFALESELDLHTMLGK